MILNIVLLLSGVFVIYYSICTLISYVPNKFVLVFLHHFYHFSPYCFNFLNTEHQNVPYLYPLKSLVPIANTTIQIVFSYDNASNSILIITSTSTYKHVFFTKHVIPFLPNAIFQQTNALPFEEEALSIYTMLLLRENLDWILYYIRIKTLDKTSA